MGYLEPIFVLIKALESYGYTCDSFPADLRELVQAGTDVIRIEYVGGQGIDRDAHEDMSRVDIVVASADKIRCLATHNQVRDHLMNQIVEVEGDVIDRVETEIRWRNLHYADPDIMCQMMATYRVFARDD